MVRIAVIGAGVSGLSVAYHLLHNLQKQNENFTLDVYEKEKRVGGTIHSFQEDGFLIEAGPNGFLNSKPSTLQLCSLLNIDSKLLPANQASKRRYIYIQRKLQLIPEKPISFLTSDVLSLKGKLRFLMEPFIKKGPSDRDETIAEFGKRRIGKEAVENLLDPMVTGVFAGDPHTMSLKACFPRIWELEQQYGSLTKALIEIRKKRKTSGPAGPGGILTSFPQGIEYLVERISQKNLINIYYNQEIEDLDYNQGYWYVDKNNETPYDVVISAVPAYNFAFILRNFSPSLSQKLAAIPYSPMAVLGLGYKKEKVQDCVDGFGFLIPHKEKRKILGCLFSSNIFPGRAPQGYELIKVLAGGARFPRIKEYSESRIKDFCLDEIKSILNIKDKPDFMKMFRYSKAIPQYRRGHLSLVEDVKKDIKPYKGLFFTGNAYYGVALNDCTHNSSLTAHSVISYLKKYKK